MPLVGHPQDDAFGPRVLGSLDDGGLPERTNGAASKAVVALTGHRGFESHTLRQPQPADYVTFGPWRRRLLHSSPSEGFSLGHRGIRLARLELWRWRWR